MENFQNENFCWVENINFRKFFLLQVSKLLEFGNTNFFLEKGIASFGIEVLSRYADMVYIYSSFDNYHIMRLQERQVVDNWPIVGNRR